MTSTAETQNITPVFISDRFYVLERFVQERHLHDFIYQLEADEEKDEYGELLTGVSVPTIRTYIRTRIKGQIYFGFSRGNIGKLAEHFGDLPWVDLTAAPPLAAKDLKFTRKLYSWAEDGKGQVEAVRDWLRARGGIIRAAPRFGKTNSGIYIAVKLGLKTVIIAHQIDLLRQFYKTFVEATNVEEIWEENKNALKKQNKKDATGRVVGFFHDYTNPEELDVCLLCWQTLASKKNGLERIAKYSRAWGLVMVDECHKMGGIACAKAVNQLSGKYRLGLTGTVERTDGKEFLIKDVIGPVTAQGRSRQIPCEVVAIKTRTTVPFSMSDPWPYLAKRLYNDKRRQKLILSYLHEDVKAGRWICFGFHAGSVNQLNDFCEKLTNLGYRAAPFHGKLQKDIREETLEKARNGEIQILVCNINMLTGIDIPRWDTYYVGFPNGSIVFNQNGEISGNFYQQYSRIRTPYVDETTGVAKHLGLIRDFQDENKICFGLSKKRLKAYYSENFQVTFQEAEVPSGNDRQFDDY